MHDSLDDKCQVASFVERRVNQSPYSQKEIAEMCGFNTPNIITMLKQGSTKVPVEKIPALAKALDVDQVEFFTLVMKNYRPKEYEVIVKILGDPISEAERNIVKLLRDTIPDGRLINNTAYYKDKIRDAITN